MSLLFINEPFVLIMRCFERRWPEISATIVLVEDLHAQDNVWGRICFPDDGGTPEIVIDCNAPIRGVMDLLAHELAHAVAPDDDNHGAAWKAAFDQIHEDYCQAIDRQIRTGEPFPPAPR